MRRTTSIIFGIALFILSDMGSIAQGQSPKNWNVLLITADTLRWDHVGYSGSSPAQTPEIDRLAKESAVFTHAYSHNPITLAAHANILTGRLPLAHGIHDNATFRLTPDETMISEYLKGKGYRTGAFIGAFPVSSQFGFNQGFDIYDDELESPTQNVIYFVERPAEKVVNPALAWIRQQKGKWFTWVHLYDPHYPYAPPPAYRQRYPRNPYAGEVAYLDAQLGRIFAYLRQSRQLENTLIVFTGDHGEALGDKGETTHSYFAYESTIRIPLFIHVPRGKPVTVKENASHIDIFPTICSLLGMTSPSGLQGESLLPLIQGGKRKEKRIYFESLTPYFSFNWAPLHGFIRDAEKFIDLPIPELYRLDSDPKEDKNLAPNRDVSPYQQSLAFIMKRNTLKKIENASLKPDEPMLRKLRSLGYLSGENTPDTEKKSFGVKDDLKTMLPLYQLQEKSVVDYQEGRIDQALAQMWEVTEKAPQYMLVYTLLASFYLELDRPREAVTVLQKGLKNLPGNMVIQAKLGAAYTEAGNPQAAIPILEACLRKDAHNPSLLNSLGLAYERSGKPDLALTHYEKSLQHDPRSAATCNNLGNLYLNRFFKERNIEWQQQALKYFQRAKSLSPKMANALNGLAMALFYGGRPEEAIAELAAAEKLFPTHRMILYNSGIILLESGRPADALKRLLKFQQLFGKTLPDLQRQRLEALIAEARG